MLAGGMAEWSMAVVLKTTKVQAFGGSNPSPSASALFEGASRARLSMKRVLGPVKDRLAPRSNPIGCRPQPSGSETAADLQRNNLPAQPESGNR